MSSDLERYRKSASLKNDLWMNNICAICFFVVFREKQIQWNKIKMITTVEPIKFSSENK